MMLPKVVPHTAPSTLRFSTLIAERPVTTGWIFSQIYGSYEGPVYGEKASSRLSPLPQTTLWFILACGWPS